jgi:hypothetical protein
VNSIAPNPPFPHRIVARSGIGPRVLAFESRRLSTFPLTLVQICTTLRELPTGTLHAMLKHLGLKLEDIQ